MIALVIGVFVAWMLRCSYRRFKHDRIQHEYFNAMLAGEKFTEAQHENIRRWLEELK